VREGANLADQHSWDTYQYPCPLLTPSPRLRRSRAGWVSILRIKIFLWFAGGKVPKIRRKKKQKTYVIDLRLCI
jgi:hypothetical protein